MRRVTLTLAAVMVLTFATALPVASSGLTDVTVSCDDGSSFTATVDADTLEGLGQALEAMALFPAGLNCSLAAVPLILPLGGVASAWPGGGFIVGGGRFQAGCPGMPLLSFWVNFAVSAHTDSVAAGDTRGGTLNFTIPAGQCVGPSHLTSKPTCLTIDAETGTPPEGFYRPYLWSHVTQTSGPVGASAAPAALHVEGNRLMNATGQPVVMHGVNRQGTEYMCAQGRAIFDGPSDQASIDAIKSWRANAVRVPLNEDCWLGINGVPPEYGGAAYRQAIAEYVGLLEGSGLYAILDLHWAAPGTTLANGPQPMPDADHSPAFWTDVATTFKGNDAVILELFNEPVPDSNQDSDAAWTCWRDGGTCPGVPYEAAG